MEAIKLGRGTRENPWTFGEGNRFRVATYLEDGDREIDVDEDAAVLNVELRMLENTEKLMAIIKKATIDYDFSGQNIILHGMQDPPPSGSNPQKGSVELIKENVELKPDTPILLKLTVKTGFWGSTTANKAERGPAPAGQKVARVNLEYELRHDSPDGRASENAVMLLNVAKD